VILGQLLPQAGEKVDAHRPAYGMIKVGVYFHGAAHAEVKKMFGPSREHTPQFGRDSLVPENLARIVPDVFRERSSYWDPRWNERLLFWLEPPYHSIEQGMPLILSGEQSRHAEPTPGHHRLRGVVGSGKTHVIAHRAARLASEGLRVLVLCFNITLRNYLEDLIKRAPYGFSWKCISINHYHGLCWDLLNAAGKPRPVSGASSREDFFREEVTEAARAAFDSLTEEDRASWTYDAILIDEGQDFHLEWYRLLAHVLSPRNELFLVCDKKQNIYERELTWVEGSMRGQGTQFRGKWRELTTIYRLPEEIADVTERFAREFGLDQELKVRAVRQPQLFDRPLLPELRWTNIEDPGWIEEIRVCLRQCFRELQSPSDIVVLLPDHVHGLQMVEALNEDRIATNHVFARTVDGSRARKRGFYQGDGRLKVCTFHSFKGWEAMNVILYIPASFSDEGSVDALVYTALTRARQKLFVFNASSRYGAFGQAVGTGPFR
jgi:hypothetical protein